MTNPEKAHQGWIATLNNGEMAFEQPPVKGERTSWQKLLQHCRETTFMAPVYEIVDRRKIKVGEEETQLKITSLRLQRGGLNITAMPKKAVDGYYQAYEHRLKSLFRPEAGSVQSQGIGSVVGDLVHITWISAELDDMGLVKIQQDVRPLEGSILHTTLFVPKDD